MKKGSKYILVSIVVVILILAIILAVYKTNLTGKVVQQTSANPYNINWDLDQVRNIGTEVSNLNTSKPILEEGMVLGQWTYDLEAAKAFAKANNKFVLINMDKRGFYSMQSSYGGELSNALDRLVYSNPAFSDWIKYNNISTVFANSEELPGENLVRCKRAIKYHYPEPFLTVRQLYLDPEFNFEDKQLPHIILIDGDGNLIGKFYLKKIYVNFYIPYWDNYYPFKRSASPEIATKDILNKIKLLVENYTQNSSAVQSLRNSSGYFNINWSMKQICVSNISIESVKINPKVVAADTGSVGAQWTKDLEAAKELAKRENKFVLILFSKSSGCSYCNNFDVGVLSTTSFKKWVKTNDLPMVYANRGNQEAEPGKTIKELFPSKNCTKSYPTTILIDGDGNLIGCFVSRGTAVYNNDLQFNGGPDSYVRIIKSMIDKYAANRSASSAITSPSINSEEELDSTMNQLDSECADGSCGETFDETLDEVATNTYPENPQSNQPSYDSCVDNCKKNKLSTLGCGKGIIGRIRCFRKSCETFCRN